MADHDHDPIGDFPDDNPVIDQIVVQQDVGGPYPVFKKVTLDLRENGQVYWHGVEEGL